jgi:biopolymer transport protein ExbB/TolQ
VLFVQYLDRYRTVCLLLTELLPVLGLLGTVFSLMFTFKTFQVATAGDAPDLSQMVQAFAPAMSTTISGLLMIVPNLVLNAILGLACPTPEKGHGQS